MKQKEPHCKPDDQPALMELIHESPGDSAARGSEAGTTLVRLTAAGHQAALECSYPQFMNKLESEIGALGATPPRAIEFARVPADTFDAGANAGGDAAGAPVVSWIKDSDHDRFLLELQPEHTCFSGHFDGHPILPGVVELHWAATLARSRFGFSSPLREVLQLKFRQIAIPPRMVELQIERPVPSRVAFRLVSFQQIHAQGVLVFDGMA